MTGGTGARRRSATVGETTRFAKAMVAKLGYWRPVWLRCGLWVAIAVLSSLHKSLTEFAALGTVDWYDWNSAIIKASLDGLITWRVYLDSSYSNFKTAAADREKAANEGTNKFYNQLPP